VSRVDFPQLPAGIPVKANQCEAGGAVEAFGAKTGAVSAAFLVLFKGKGLALDVVGKPKTTNQHVLVDADVSPLFPVTRLVAGKFDVPQRHAGFGVQNVARCTLDDVHAVVGNDVIGAAGVGTGNMHLIVARVERSITVGRVVVDVEHPQILKLALPQHPPGVNVTRA
jgi:hypothetical protein